MRGEQAVWRGKGERESYIASKCNTKMGKQKGSGINETTTTEKKERKGLGGGGGGALKAKRKTEREYDQQGK